MLSCCGRICGGPSANLKAERRFIAKLRGLCTKFSYRVFDAPVPRIRRFRRVHHAVNHEPLFSAGHCHVQQSVTFFGRQALCLLHGCLKTLGHVCGGGLPNGGAVFVDGRVAELAFLCACFRENNNRRFQPLSAMDGHDPDLVTCTFGLSFYLNVLCLEPR